MAKNTSATMREETPHVNQTTKIVTVINALKRRAQAVLNDPSIDPQSRAIIRYGLETNDPWLAELVRRADAGESLIDTAEFSETPEANEHATDEHVSSDNGSTESDSRDVWNTNKIEALAEIICGAGGEAAGALFVLIGTLENSTEPQALANAVKHFAFTRCGELNLYGLVDAQIAVLEGELLAHNAVS